MPILSTIGRRSFKVRMLILAIYVLLIGGAISMVYPFGLMIAGSTKSNMDRSESRLIPRFVTDDDVLWAKHVEGLFNESLDMMRQVHDSDAASFKKVTAPKQVNPALVEAWKAFLADKSDELPHYTYTIGYLECRTSKQTIPAAAREFKKRMIDRFDGDVRALNHEMETEFINMGAIIVRRESYLMRRERPLDDPFALAVREFKAERPIEERYYFTVEGFFKHQFLKIKWRKIGKKDSKTGGYDEGSYNAEHGTSYESYDQVHLPRRLPAGEGATDSQRADWTEFVRSILNPLWVRVDADSAEALRLYHEFLLAKHGSAAAVAKAYGKPLADIALVQGPPADGVALTDWNAFFVRGWEDPATGKTHILPAEHIRIHSVDWMFRDYLRNKYADIKAFNSVVGTSHGDWIDILPPQRDMHYLAFTPRTGELRREFAVRNYLSVFDYLLLHGRGLLNTAIYCGLAVLGALLVNPLAAYALSRYKPPSSYKILLFLMLTMAFPPIVAQIPVFLMLREFNMLNTFWALILPGLANGYSIFLLKGFFDSQPRELYESAEIDGAGEFRIFWQITMSLSKPILAVIALGAFTMAYSNFMFALLTCQDRKMWTLMVWLYRLQQFSHPGVVYASLLISGVPILVVFALCQKVIMRGIIVPVEK